MTIYRGYEIKKGHTGYWIYKDIQCCIEAPFKTEEAAMDAIDQWKLEQAKGGKRQ